MTFEEVQEMIKKPFLLEKTKALVTVRNPERYGAAHKRYGEAILPNGYKSIKEKEEC